MKLIAGKSYPIQLTLQTQRLKKGTGNRTDYAIVGVVKLNRSTSENHRPASLLGSDSGNAHTLYSAPKHLIDSKFRSKHADV